MADSQCPLRVDPVEKGLVNIVTRVLVDLREKLAPTNHDSVFLKLSATGTVMMGRQSIRASCSTFSTSKNRFQRIISYAGSIQSWLPARPEWER
jgi:hypothetical protein